MMILSAKKNWHCTYSESSLRLKAGLILSIQKTCLLVLNVRLHPLIRGLRLMFYETPIFHLFQDQ